LGQAGSSSQASAERYRSALDKEKRRETHGYKNHINADAGNKLIQSYSVTPAAVHDSQVFDELLDPTIDAHGNKRAVYADSAYRSEAQEQRLADADIESQVCEKGTRGKPLTEEQKLSNRTKSKVRSRVEHVFGAQAAMGGHVVRTIGLQRANVKIGLMNLVYNMKRLIQLIKLDATAAKRDLTNHHREGAPVVA